MARARRRTVSRGTPRKFIWARSRSGGTFTGGGSAVDLLTGFEAEYGADLIGTTVTRIRGYIVAAPETAINGGCRFAAMVHKGGLVASPDYGPYTLEHADWMLWEPFGSNVIIDTDDVSNRVVDVKSMRKLDELSDQLIMFFQGTPSVPAAVWNYAWDLSIGLKLP